MSCGCKKRIHPVQQQSTPTTIKLTEVKKEEPKTLTDAEARVVQQIVEEIKKLNQ